MVTMFIYTCRSSALEKEDLELGSSSGNEAGEVMAVVSESTVSDAPGTVNDAPGTVTDAPGTVTDEPGIVSDRGRTAAAGLCTEGEKASREGAGGEKHKIKIQIFNGGREEDVPIKGQANDVVFEVKPMEREKETALNKMKAKDLNINAKLLGELKELSTKEEDKNAPGILQAQEKLANAEKKLAEEVKAKIEKKSRYKAIIEEDEKQLKVLAKEMQELSEAIKKKEMKIIEMKIEKKKTPFLRKCQAQFHITKSILRKERLEEDLAMLRSQTSARNRRIQKYKTKIRYDLQTLNDIAIATVNPLREPRAKKVRKPIPGCFFVDNPVPPPPSPVHTSSNQMVTTCATNEIPTKEKFKSSRWTLSSVDVDEISTLSSHQLLVEAKDTGNSKSSSDQTCSEEGKHGLLPTDMTSPAN